MYAQKILAWLAKVGFREPLKNPLKSIQIQD
jgi:hypothetical protein